MYRCQLLCIFFNLWFWKLYGIMSWYFLQIYENSPHFLRHCLYFPLYISLILHMRLQMFVVSATSRETGTNVYLPQLEKQQQTTPKFNLVNRWVLLGPFTGVWVKGYIQKQEGLKGSCLIKTYPAWKMTHKARTLEFTTQHTGCLSGQVSVFFLPGLNLWGRLSDLNFSQAACLFREFLSSSVVCISLQVAGQGV